ncbi:MAG: SH3 domain-containing protein, partial [Casimicrobiaceae bacterium]
MTRIRRRLLLAVFLVAIPAIALAQEAYTSRTSNVRAGPDRSYPVVATLPPGAGLQVMGCIEDYSWCDVVFADNRGWIYAGSLV